MIFHFYCSAAATGGAVVSSISESAVVAPGK